MARGWFICGGSSKDTVPRPPLREGSSPVNAYWWTRKVLAENEVDLDDVNDLADGKSRVMFTSVGPC